MILAAKKRDGRSRVHGTALRSAVAVLGLFTALLAAGPAHAQFVCDSVTPGGADGATATGSGAMACGTSATANGGDSTAFGHNATATASSATAVGVDAQATGVSSSAFGQLATASGASSTAVGFNSTATGQQSTAVGGSTASGDFSSAFGSVADASGSGSVAVGTFSQASGASSIAIGAGANAGFANSIAIGPSVSTTRANQVAIGSATQTYTFAGVTSAASTAAQTGPVSVVTTDASGNLAAVDLASLGLSGGADLSEINSRLDQHDKKIAKNTEGVAIALAMAGVPTLTASEKFAMSANWGTFEGENGFAGGAAIRLDSNIQLNGGIGFGGETVGGRAGVRIGW
jgi:autotransporter adhesin